MTQEPPPSWPHSGQDGWEPLSVDPITGEPITPARGPAEAEQPSPFGVPMEPTSQNPAPYPAPYPAAPYPTQNLPAQEQAAPYFPAPPPGQQPYAQQPYAQQQYGAPPPGWGYPAPPPYAWAVPRATNGMAIAAMILGIVWVYWIGSLLALVLGYTARAQIKRTGEGGDGMALAGIILGWIGIGVLAAILIFSGVLSATRYR
ncbi:DUF4190 domain-containing protein [Pseudonocardia sp. GCM10023141]|uniref:DUF4190 domain-containing protein n=1 Tax=Pseudonocardia sp. GCM10023141 TaxID=3252653 RepID=UPI00362142AF